MEKPADIALHSEGHGVAGGRCECTLLVTLKSPIINLPKTGITPALLKFGSVNSSHYVYFSSY